jgi:hypothetical protein
MTRKSSIALISLGALVLVVLYFVYGCEYVDNVTASFPSPLENVDFHSYSTLRWVTSPSQRVGIHLKLQSDIKRLVDLRAFGSFQPEMTDEDVVAQFGQPIQTWTDNFGGTWAKYSTLLGYVQIGCDRRTSLQDDHEKGPGPCRRSLQAFTDQSPSEIFRSSFLDVLDRAEKMAPRADYRDIDFFDSENRLVLNVFIKRGHITHMELFRRVDR